MGNGFSPRGRIAHPLRVVAFLFGFLGLTHPLGLAATYEVGPGKPYATIGAVPWDSLTSGSTVLIYWRAAPYQEKWVICRRGAPSAPITVRGVAGPGGQPPVIEGRDAVTPPALNYWNEDRSVLKIGGANRPTDTTPAHITIENLDIRSGRPPYSFTDDSGSVRSYSSNAASIFVEKGDRITIRNCVLHDSGNGLFIAAATSSALIEKCWIYDNGIEGSIYEHNSYTEAAGITFQYNYYGPLRAQCLGNNLKDRSAGLVVRSNWIESGNRQLDLVDAEGSQALRDDPRYRETFVYGNVLIEPDGAGNSQIVHYGGDSGSTDWYRKGTLYFYNNSVISTRSGNTTLFRLSTNDERADCRNNVVYVSATGNRLAMLADAGVLDLSHNWFKNGWVASHSGLTGAIHDDGTTVKSAAPGFVNEAAQDFHLRPDSVCVNAGTALHTRALPNYDVLYQYVRHRASERRPRDGTLDLGAFEAALRKAGVRRGWNSYTSLAQRGDGE